MNILFIHQSFPGQFVHLAANLAKNGAHKVVALSMYTNPVPEGVILRPYQALRAHSERQHPLLKDPEAKIMRAEACAAAAIQLRNEGFEPELVIAHPGWGESLFIKDVFPKARLAVYCEFHYAAEGRDVGFDPEEPPLRFDQRCALRMRNMANLLSLEAADLAFAPTEWQRSTYPAPFRERIAVIHDGIDLDRLAYRKDAILRIAKGDGLDECVLRPGDEVLTYVARNLEPVRGFHMLMRVLPEVLRQRPEAHVVIVGGDRVSYGRGPEDGGSWKNVLLKEVGADLDLARVHFVGNVSESVYLDLLSISKVHAYWTTPFVLSWSFMEAALAGVPVVASDTPPVREFAQTFGTQLVDFFDRDGFARGIVKRLAVPRDLRKPRKLGRFSVVHCVAKQKKYLGIAD
ncbi:MAG: glycosyltransferase [Proteobacteria bacterium]|nr:glycosyltransferase [Pseudomonadota bacterium]